MTESHDTTVARLLADGHTLEEAYAKCGQPQQQPVTMAHLVGNRAKRMAQRSQERRDNKRSQKRCSTC